MKKNLPLIVGVSLPIIFVAIIALIVYFPTNFVNPKNNFLYVGDSYGSYENTYVIKDNKITLQKTNFSKEDYYGIEPYPVIYLYDFERDASYEISLEDAQKYFVEKGPSSPEGYTVVRNNNHSGIFEIFGSYENNSGQFIVAPDGSKKKLNGVQGSYYSDLEIIGWVK